MNQGQNILQMSQDQFLFKIILLGNSGVGKSKILIRYKSGEFDAVSKQTIGIEFASKSLTLNKVNQPITLQIWDTAGQETFKAITKAYYKNAVGALVVYDISDRKSFESVNFWLNDLNEHGGNIVKLLIGNKSDKEDQRDVKREEALEFAEKNKIGFMETSALNGQNINACFEKLAEEIYNVIKSIQSPQESKENEDQGNQTVSNFQNQQNQNSEKSKLNSKKDNKKEKEKKNCC